MSYEMKIKYADWEALKDEIFRLKQLRIERDAHLKEIRWLADRTIWHPGTRIKHILEHLEAMDIQREVTESTPETTVC